MIDRSKKKYKQFNDHDIVSNKIMNNYRGNNEVRMKENQKKYFFCHFKFQKIHLDKIFIFMFLELS